MPQYLKAHGDPAGVPSTDLWRQGMLDFAQMNVDASVLWIPVGPAPLVIEAQQSWQGVGPNSGEVTDIAIDPNGSGDNVIYISTNDGGIWKTEDGGATWTQNMDDLLSLSMGAIAIDASSPAIQRIIYAGTGNMYDGGIAFNKGIGIFRSSDGGSSWSIVDGGPFATVFAGKSINDIEVIAADTLLVATDQGLYRSADGGQNFGSNDPSFDNQLPVLPGLITCILPDVADPAKTIYVCISAVGIKKSTDGGKNFAPAPILGPATAGLGANFNNIQLAQSEKNPKAMCALVQYTPPAPPKVLRGLYRSLDGGTTWNAISNLIAVAGSPAGDGFDQTGYDMIIGIDPQIALTGNPNPNAGSVFAGFQELWRSLDGGQTFQPSACTANQVHWDDHVLVFSPAGNRPAGKPTPMYLGTDGGIAKSLDGGTTWKPINGGIGSNLFRGIDIGRGSPNNNIYTYGGMQDTGVAGHRPAFGTRPADGATDWHAGINGDGYVTAVDPANSEIVYSFDDWLFIKSTDGGATWADNSATPPAIGAGLPIPPNPGPVPFAIALGQDGAAPANRVIYVGAYNQVYKSTNAGATFASVLTVGPAANGYFIMAAATTAADPKRVWVGVNDKSVHYSADGGNTWDPGGFQTLPGGTGMVRGIAIDPVTPDRVAVVYDGNSGIHPKFRTKRVFMTTDSGQTWHDVSCTDGGDPLNNLPDLPMHSAVFDQSTTPPALIVASDAGVMRSTNITISGDNVTATWALYGVGLPTVCCNSLAIDNSAHPPLLRVGTYGRSAFEATRPTTPRLYCSPSLGFGSVPTGGKGTLPIYLYNCGSAQLSISAMNFIFPSNFALNPAPSFPINIDPGKGATVTVVYSPTAVADDSATLDIESNDPSPSFVVTAIGRGVAPGKPRLATNPVGKDPAGKKIPIGFGAASADQTLTVQLFNVGTSDLNISGITHGGSNDFSLDPAPTFLLNIPAGGESDLSIKYHPTSNGAANATFQIASNDVQSPYTFGVSGTGVNISSAGWKILEYIGIGLLIAGGLVLGGYGIYEALNKSKKK